MKVRVSLREQSSNVNVVITADGTATVGDVAVAIASAGKDELVDTDSGLTLRLCGGGASAERVIIPSTTLVESGVQNGSTIEVTSAAGTRGDDRAAAELRVTDGPDKGVVVRLRRGTSTVGRAADRDVRLTDSRVSHHHGRITVSDRVEIIDDNSSNGVVVGDQRVARAILGPGDVALLGSTRVTVTLLGGAGDSAQASSATSDVAFIRSPVVLSRPREIKVELPDVPAMPQRPEFPWLALVAPLLMGGGMFLVTRSPLSLIFVALSPILMLGTYLSTLFGNKKAVKRDEEQFRSSLALVEADIASRHQRELQQRLSMYPSVGECVDAVFERNSRLWSRRPEHPEFLRVRLATGPVRPSARFEDAKKSAGRPDLAVLADELVRVRGWLAGAPLVADLAAVGGVGVVGRAGVREGVARAIVAQVASMHSPAEVTIACLTSTATKDEWAWLEWLPHTTAYSPFDGVQLAAEAGSGRLVLDRLEDLVAARSSATTGDARDRGPQEKEHERTRPVLPSVLVVVHNPSVDWARVATLAENGPDVGVHVLWVADEQASLPGACRAFIDLGDGSSTIVGMVRTEQTVRAVSTESLDLVTATAMARRLAPVMDAGIRESDESDLPRTVSVVSLLGVDSADDESLVLTRWKENGSYLERALPPRPTERASDLRAVVGHAGAEPFSLDLRSQGPHALVGGTTGSGKSEFLQAWVLGLAHAYSPDRVTFLFVDYKGGAAFAKCVELPHTVGMVTDLSPYLVQRALRSLRAEIHHRERLLNDKGVKDLIELEKRGDPDCPPSLLIIVDEFAALVGEVPEFIDGVVDVAQRGRSLGLHLILATQRPAGVIKDNLRANTNLRVALRVNDDHDSTDVIGDKLASHFDPSIPGRGAAKTGPARLTTFQSAFPGARTTTEPPAPPIEVAEVDFGVVSEWKIPARARVDKDTPTDIDRVVGTVSRAARLGRIPTPRKPWLDVLAPAYDLSKLNQRSDSDIVLGVVDDPDHQAQTTDTFRPDERGHILYVGTGGSGKTTALRTLAMAASVTPKGGPVHVYGLDFAGGGLSLLEPLPSVGSIIAGDDDERVSRLLSMLATWTVQRQARYSAAKAPTLTAYRHLAAAPHEPRILVLLDGLESFKDAYDSALSQQRTYSDFQTVVMDGRSVGIHFAVTADRLGAVPNSLSGAFQQKLVLRLTDEDAYLSAGIPKNILNAQSPPGRCVQIGRSQELQLAILGRNGTPSVQVSEIDELSRAVAAIHPVRPASVGSLPTRVALSELPPALEGRPVVGIEDRSLGALGFDGEGTFVIAGPPRSGRSTALHWFADSIRRWAPSVPLVHLSARPSRLTGLPQWQASVIGADRVREYAGSQLKPYVERDGGGKPLVAVFIEDLPELCGTVAEAELAEIVKLARRNGHLVFASGETSGFSSGFSSLTTEIKAGRAGVILHPDQHDGDLLKTPLPRLQKSADMLPGRGYFIQGGKAWRVQLPVVG
ncbi:MAG TPA: FtsK/SpoIIIE domain-containing protein [Arachnia sp.]|nr:FtsK/SpoIIIE domain-containing protein [Arachnia sp.]